ncbi:MAG: type I restriction enzyme HsdR N-terminal domain-containing protein [Deltaproteobacteria bacterium]|nr:type I restriction enzyme HsdR N-terminal domain-containing protein [Deltaproteobacteria bacterium]
MPPKYEINAKNRIKTFLKKFADVVKRAEDAGFNESDTRTLVLEVLTSALGYDKFFEITGEFEIKGRYADFAIRLDNKIRFFVEVKAIGSKLSGKDLFQIQSYSASHNLVWMILSNGRMWKCYHLSQGNPPEIEEVFNVDLVGVDLINITEKMYLLSKEAIWRDALSDFWEVARASSPTSIGQCLISPRVIDEIRREIYRTMKQKLDNDTIREILTTQVIKGNILSQIDIDSKPAKKDSDKTNEASKKKGLPAVCFAYVPDDAKPSTWKLRYRNPDGSVSSSHLAAAVAALSPGGFRGRRVEIPLEHITDVKRRLFQAYKEIGTTEDQIPPEIRHYSPVDSST